MLKSYLAAAKNILFPSLCLFCQNKTKREFLCSNCRKNISFLQPFPGALSAVAYQEPIITLVHCFKYQRSSYLADFLSLLMAKHLKRIGFSFAGYDFITSVPMHKDKLKSRGYNQAQLLAKGLSKYFKIPSRDDIIYEINFRPSQARLPQEERQANVQGNFKVRVDLKRTKIIIVDDILTTGSTLKACSTALKEKGTELVTAITLAKTIKAN